MSYDRQIALVLCALFILAPAQLSAGQLPGQPAQPVPPAEPTTAQPRQPVHGSLKILVLEGQNAVNSLTSKSAISPVVQVLDSVEQPVEGATVTFEVSPVGPGGAFNNAPLATARTDYSGQATAHFTPNSTAGSFFIKVTASISGQTTEARIRQTNDAKALEAANLLPSHHWYKSWKWWAVIGAGAGAGIAAAMLLRDNTSTITIAPGPIVVGGPR